MENPSTEIGKRKRKSLGKRFVRFVLISAAVFVVIFLLGIVFFRLYFPPDKIRRIADDYSRKHLNRQLTIGNVSVNPWWGFEINDLRLTPVADSVGPEILPVDSASVERVVLRYSLAQLFQRRILIKRVEIDSPTIALTIKPAQTDSTPAKMGGNPLAVLDSLVLPESPIYLDLDHAHISDGAISLTLVDSLVRQQIIIDQLGLSIDDLKIPKGRIDHADLAGRMALTVDSGRVSLLQTQSLDTLLFAGARLDLNIEAALRGLTLDPLGSSARMDSLAWAGSLVEELPFHSLPMPIELSLSGRIDLNEKSVTLNPLTLLADNKKWLQLSAEATNLSTKPELDLRLSHGKIELQQLLSAAQMLLPDTLLPEIFMHNPQATLCIDELSAQGLIPLDPENGDESIRFSARASLKDFGVTVNYGQFELTSFSLSAGTKGMLQQNGLAGLSADLNVRYDSLYVQANDTLSLFTGPLRTEARTTVGSDLFPNKVHARFTLSNVFGSSVEGSVDLKGISLAQLRGSGAVTISDLFTENLPNVPVETSARAALNLSVQTLDSVSVTLNAVTDSIRLEQGSEKLVFPPVLANTVLVGGTKASLDEIVVRNWSAEVANLFQGRLSGKAFPKKKSVEIHVDDVTVAHNHLLEWVPNQYKSLLQDLELTGQTRLTGFATASLAGSEPQYETNFRVKTDIGRLAFPPLYISLGKVALAVNGKADWRTGSVASVDLRIDSTLIETVRPDPLLNTQLLFQVTSADFLSARVDSGRLLIPGLGVGARLSARVDSLPTNPHVSAEAVVEQIAAQPLFLTRDISLSGSTRLEASVEMDTTSLLVDGELIAKNLSLYLPAQMEVSDINARIQFAQGVDLTKGMLFPKSRPHFATPSTSTIDYHLFRPFYQKTRDDISTLSISRIRAAGYVIDNIRMEAYIGDGAVEVPTLSAKIYGGTMDGRFSLDLSGANPDSMSYLLSAHFAGINSALLLPQGSKGAGDGIINANLNLAGSGVNPEGDMNFGGFFYITRIGPRVADNLLRSLDPEGIDSGIKLTRWFINQGFKPKLFTFMIRNNYFYPTVEFNQPFYFPVRLSGGRVELNRMPANFFIRTALKNARMQSARR